MNKRKTTNMKPIVSILLFILLMPSLLVYGQNSKYDLESNNIFHRFGYQFSILSLNKFDSNVLKLSTNTSDFSSGLYPSATITYPFSANTQLTAQYLLGLEKYVTTSSLNTNFHRFKVKLSQYFSPSLIGQISGDYLKSDQPDLLTSRSSMSRFATFNQYSASFKLNWLKSSKTLYSLEYLFIQRHYSYLLTLALNKQQDNYNYITLGWLHQFNKATTARIKLGLINSNSNNLFYRFNRPFLDISLSHNLGSGFIVQTEDIISLLRFTDRTITNDPFTKRGDIINTLMVGLKKSFSKNIAMNISYYLQKDFSNEPFRKYLSHSVNLGIKFVIGKDSYYPEQFNSSELGLGLDNYLELNKDKTTVEQLTNTGYQYLLKGNYDKALEYSLQALLLDNNIEQAHINAGISYYKNGMKKEAIIQWEAALKLNPKNDKLKALIEKARTEEKTQ